MEQVSIFASISIAVSIMLPVLNIGKSIDVYTLSVAIDARCEWALRLYETFCFPNSIEIFTPLTCYPPLPRLVAFPQCTATAVAKYLGLCCQISHCVVSSGTPNRALVL